MLKYIIRESYFFYVEENAVLIPVKNWISMSSGEISAQTLLLKEIFENGKADYDEYNIIVSHEEICLLDSIDKQILNLPNNYPFDIYIISNGQLNQKDFQLNYGFYEYAPLGNQLQVAKRTGNHLELSDGAEYLLSYSTVKSSRM